MTYATEFSKLAITEALLAALARPQESPYHQQEAEAFSALSDGLGDYEFVVLPVHMFPGATAGAKIAAALASAYAARGSAFETGAAIVDMRGLYGTQIISTDVIDAGFHNYAKAPVTWLWGNAEYWIEVPLRAMTNHRHHFEGAHLIFGKKADGTRNLGQNGFLHTSYGVQLVTAVGSGDVTMTGSAYVAGIANAITPGHSLAIFGHIPKGGRDETTLTADPGAGGMTLAVASTAGYQTSGYLVLPNNAGTDFEIVRYTSIDATNFFLSIRGYGGSTAVAHNVGTAVNRAVYETFIAKSVAGAVITLDEGRTIPFTSAFIDCNVGLYRFVLSGFGTIDGNMDPAVNDAANPMGLNTIYERHGYVGPGLIFKNWDHGTSRIAAQDCEWYAKVVDCTRPSLFLGAATWLFGNCKRNTNIFTVENCYSGCVIDSRTVQATLPDGPSDDNVVIIRHARKVTIPILFSGGRGNYMEVQNAVGMPSTGIGIAEDGDNQWLQSANSRGYVQDNILVAGVLQGAAGMLAISVSTNFGKTNVVISRTPGVPLNIPAANTDIDVQGPKGRVTLVDAVTIVTDSCFGEIFEVTLGGNRTMGAPTKLWKGKFMRYVVTQDGTGGRTLGWNAVFRQTWSDVGNVAGAISTIDFYCYDGTNLTQVGIQPYV